MVIFYAHMIEYMNFREKVRSQAWKDDFSALDERKEIADGMESSKVAGKINPLGNRCKFR